MAVLRNRVREFRELHRLTQEELARRAGVAPAVVVRLENVPGYAPRMSVALRLCEVFNAELGVLFWIERSDQPQVQAAC